VLRSLTRYRLVSVGVVLVAAMSSVPSPGTETSASCRPRLEIEGVDTRSDGAYVLYPSQSVSLEGTGWAAPCGQQQTGSAWSCGRPSGPQPVAGIRVWVVRAGPGATRLVGATSKPAGTVGDLGTYTADDRFRFVIGNVTMPKVPGDYVFVADPAGASPPMVVGRLHVL
jgi:hypothetical protein